VEVATRTTESTREAVMVYVWDETFISISRQEYDKAETSFAFFVRLDEMTDEEYEEACECEREGCACS
jgi:hypothetical protein